MCCQRLGSALVPALSDAQSNAVRELLRVSPVAVELGERFAAAGHTLHLVGGSVRDALLGRLGEDLDFTTDARPDAVLQVVDGWAETRWETGIAFGTVGLMRRGFRIEITTYRADAYDRTSRNPEVTFGDSLTDDLARRDFSVNAMAIALPEWRAPDAFIDPYGGMDDLAAGVLRTPGTPEQSFDDDPLRMLRAARFIAGYDLAPEPQLVDAGVQQAALVKGGSQSAVQAVLEVELALPLHDVGEEVAVERGVLVQQGREVQGVLGGDQLIDAHLPRRELGPVAGFEGVRGVGTPLTHALEDHGATI